MKRQRKKKTGTLNSKKNTLGSHKKDSYKSSLERSCAKLLTEAGVPFTYEQHEYLLVDKLRYEGVYWKMTPKKKLMIDKSNKTVLNIKYTPDFVGKNERWIIETKGFVRSADFPMRWKLFLRHLLERGQPLPQLFICRNKSQILQAIEIIKNNG